MDAKKKIIFLTTINVINKHLRDNNMLLTNNDDEDAFVFSALVRNKKQSITGSSQNVVISYSLIEFKSHFRLERETFNGLLTYINTKNDPIFGPEQLEIPIEKQLQITLWILGNQEVYRSVADRFGVCITTAWQSVNRICNFLVNNCSDFIKWPHNQAASIAVREWERVSGFPGVIGAIDGTYIPISAPSKNQASYICKNKFHAIQLQGVCTSDKKFIDIYAGWPGSVHDARIFRRSYLNASIEENPQHMFPNNTHMLGDSAYRLEPYLLVPFTSNGLLSAAQINYNKKLSSSRIIIEQAFGLLKARFRRLKFMFMRRTELIPLYILTCCILHNVCIDNNDVIEIEIHEEILNDDVNNNEEILNTGIEKRNEIMNLLFN